MSFQMENIDLRQTKAIDVVDAGKNSLSRFLESNSPEALPYKGLRFPRLITDRFNNSQPYGVPIPVVSAYWVDQSIKGNVTASRLLGACAVESIERRADKAFGKEVSEAEYNQRWQQIYQSVIAKLPSTFVDKQRSQIQVATFDGDGRKIKRLYPNGVIPNFPTKEDIVEILVILSQYANPNPWELIPGKELLPLGKYGKAKCPDFVSNVIEANGKKVVVIFQVFATIIDINSLRDCVNRNYSRLAEKQYQAEHSLLLLVSPLGMSKSAEHFLYEEIKLEDNKAYQKVGAITVKELAEFYYRIALEGKKNSKNIKTIKQYFTPFLNYQIVKEVSENIQLSLPFPSVS